MSKFYFITGIDTNIGKTYASKLLLNVLQEQALSTIALKPLAAGCELIEGKMYNQDALILQENASTKLPYELINPIALRLPVAPHIAAAKQNISLSVKKLVEKCQPALSLPADIYLIEGVGGWYVPLNAKETMADFVKALNLDVILVVGIRLGCLNHALLTYHAIKQDKCKLRGWVANCLDSNTDIVEENINLLAQMINAPLLGIVPLNGEKIFNFKTDFLLNK